MLLNEMKIRQRTIRPRMTDNPSPQIIKRQLKIIGRGRRAAVGAGGLRAVEGFADGGQVKAKQMRRQADDGDAPFARQTQNGRGADLEDGGKLSRRQKFLTGFLIGGGVIVHGKHSRACRVYGASGLRVRAMR